MLILDLQIRTIYYWQSSKVAAVGLAQTIHLKHTLTYSKSNKEFNVNALQEWALYQAPQVPLS